MYVIIDMEWIEKENGQYVPTQLAAVRTDNSGGRAENFLEFIRPEGTELYGCPAASGAEKAEGLIRAQSMRDAFSDFLSWLADEDILLFRHSDSREVYERLIFRLFGRRDTHRMLCLKSCFSGSLVS